MGLFSLVVCLVVVSMPVGCARQWRGRRPVDEQLDRLPGLPQMRELAEQAGEVAGDPGRPVNEDPRVDADPHEPASTCR